MEKNALKYTGVITALLSVLAIATIAVVIAMVINAQKAKEGGDRAAAVKTSASDAAAVSQGGDAAGTSVTGNRVIRSSDGRIVHIGTCPFDKGCDFNEAGTMPEEGEKYSATVVSVSGDSVTLRKNDGNMKVVVGEAYRIVQNADGEPMRTVSLSDIAQGTKVIVAQMPGAEAVTLYIVDQPIK